MEQLGPYAVWLVLAVACVVGYFVVGKVIDYFVKGSSFEKDEHPPDGSSGGTIGGHDPNKPIG